MTVVAMNELKKAVQEYQETNKKSDPWYGRLMFDKSDGEIWTDVFYSLGQNEWKHYHSNDIVNLGSMMLAANISVTVQNVINFLKSSFSVEINK